jgi:hypothetical protein
MNIKGFNPMEAIRFGRNTLKSNLLFFVLIMAALGAATKLPGLARSLWPQAEPFISGLSGDGKVALAIAAFAILVLLISTLEMGLLKISLQFYDNHPRRFSELLRTWLLSPSYLISSIIFLSMITVGLILLIVPGIYIFLKYQFYGYSIVDRGSGPIEALRESARITRGVKRRLITFWMILGLMVTLGLMLVEGILMISIDYMAGRTPDHLIPMLGPIAGYAMLVAGLTAALPITKLATASTYRTLERQSRLTAGDDNNDAPSWNSEGRYESYSGKSIEKSQCRMASDTADGVTNNLHAHRWDPLDRAN